MSSAPQSPNAERDRKELAESLHEAIANGGLGLYYQPLVRSGDGEVFGIEALLRWDHPTRGKVSPGEFVPVAEEHGLMTKLGRWVMLTACAQMAEWQKKGLVYDLLLHINLSHVELADRELLHTVREALETSGLEPKQLCVEVAEIDIDEAGDIGTRNLDALARVGVRLVLDDFGVGSKIESLTRFPFEFAKVERSLIVGTGADAPNSRLLRGIGGLCRSLGITLVAEGVEEEAEMTRIAALGFSRAQGYAFGRPESAELLGKTLAGERSWLTEV